MIKCPSQISIFMNNMFRSIRRSKTKSKSKGIKREVYAYKKRMRVISTIITFIIIFSFVVIALHYLATYFTVPDSAINEINGDLDANSIKAALIDALYSTCPNKEFTKSLNKTLWAVGFKVDIFQGTEVTVNFLKKLPSGYKLIILRMHSALATNNQLYFFTAEPYSVGKYTQEQYFQLVKEAYATEDSQPVFAINWGFIRKCMTGKFNGTLVVAMGCDGLRDPYVIEEILNQGAIGYISWTGPVSLSHSDKAILYLIQVLYIEKMPIEQAVKETNNQIGEDPNWSTVLDYRVP